MLSSNYQCLQLRAPPAGSEHFHCSDWFISCLFQSLVFSSACCDAFMFRSIDLLWCTVKSYSILTVSLYIILVIACIQLLFYIMARELQMRTSLLQHVSMQYEEVPIFGSCRTFLFICLRHNPLFTLCICEFKSFPYLLPSSPTKVH